MVDQIFHDVPKWEHASNGSMRIQAPGARLPGREVAALSATADEGTKS
jgi:hypothetical protein